MPASPFSIGRPACWVGRYVVRVYNGGEITYDARNGFVWCSKRDRNQDPLPRDVPDLVESRSWAYVGRIGASPGKVLHVWHPRSLQYPVSADLVLSEEAIVCSDCWKDADYKNAFDAKAHFYIIRELGYGL